MITDIITTLDAVTRLIGVVIWPGVIVIALVKLEPSFRDFFSSLGELSVKTPGFEASAKRRQAEVAAALGAAGAARFDGATTADVKAREASAAAQLVAETVTPKVIRRASRSKVLWVDDRPGNNVLERRSLEALGLQFDLATSTDEALSKVKSEQFDVIISDMGRPPDQTAGYTLLDALRSSGNQTPFIVYAGSRAPQHQSELKRRGGLGCTNRPDELFELVLEALDRNK